MRVPSGDAKQVGAGCPPAPTASSARSYHAPVAQAAWSTADFSGGTLRSPITSTGTLPSAAAAASTSASSVSFRSMASRSLAAFVCP